MMCTKTIWIENGDFWEAEELSRHVQNCLTISTYQHGAHNCIQRLYIDVLNFSLLCWILGISHSTHVATVICFLFFFFVLFFFVVVFFFFLLLLLFFVFCFFLSGNLQESKQITMDWKKTQAGSRTSLAL